MRHFHIVLQASVVLVTGNNQDLGIQLYKYDDSAGTGTLLAHSAAHNTVPGADIVQITSHADAMLDTNDYIEIHVTNFDTTNAIRVDYGYMFCVSMLH